MGFDGLPLAAEAGPGDVDVEVFLRLSLTTFKRRIWFAVFVYVLVSNIRKRLKLYASLHTILRILSVMPFEKTPFKSVF